MKRKKYSKSFKVLAVKMILEDDKKINKADKELGISVSMLAR
jgi:transposase-like protein